MTEVDMKALLGRLNRYCTRSLEAAAGVCVSRGHYEVGIEHLLLQLLDDEAADVQTILKHFEIDPSRLRKVLQRLTPVVNVAALGTEGDFLIVQFRATPFGFPKALNPATI